MDKMTVHKDFFFHLLTKANIILFVSALALVARLGWMMHQMRTPRPVSREQFKAPKSIPFDYSWLKEIHNAAGFEGTVIKNRNLFGGVTDAAQEEADKALLEINLEVVGIIAVGTQRSAIIKDTVSKQEYQCRGGERIGPYTVKNILEDRVVLQYNGSIREIFP